MDTKHLASTVDAYRAATTDADIDATAAVMMAALGDWLELHGATNITDWVEGMYGAELTFDAPIATITDMSAVLRPHGVQVNTRRTKGVAVVSL